MTPERIVVDTDVLIDHLRGNADAATFLQDAEADLLISAVTVAELFSGVREGRERSTLEGFLSAFEIVPLDAEIATRGGLFRRDFGKSHGVGLADALIAATADVRAAKLATLNVRHFPMLSNVLVPYRKST